MSYKRLAERLEAGSKLEIFKQISEQTEVLDNVQCATLALICMRSRQFTDEKLTMLVRRLERMQQLMPEGDTIRSAQVMTMVAAEVGL